MTLHLVLGGARSGKSAYAEREALARAGGARGLVYVATGEALDDEMAERIAHHRAGRDPAWRTVEAPLDLVGALEGMDAQDIVVVDCLTLWLSNAMLSEDGAHAGRVAALPKALAARRGDTWVVSNEVGFGVVPDNALARRFRDAQGRLNQSVAALADEVVLVVAGIALQIKGSGACGGSRSQLVG